MPVTAKTKPDVHSTTRFIVGFPFSTIHVRSGGSSEDQAELLARLAREVDRQHHSDETEAIAEAAQALTEQSHK